MKKVAIMIGYAPEIHYLAESLGWTIVGVVEPDKTVVLSSDVQLFPSDAALFDSDTLAHCGEAIITPDQPSRRQKLAHFYEENRFQMVTLLGGEIKGQPKIGQGTIIQAPSHVSVGCCLGVGVRVNCCANIMHDCVIGDFCTIAPSAVLLGRVQLESRVYVGANATILPGIHIGEDAVIGAGAVVTRNVPAGAIVKGVPAK